MKKLIALITTAIISASMVSSCGKAGNSSSGHKWQNSDTLNEWQIDLLEAQGLPTDIEQLTPSQKRSIQHIYEMITYLNESMTRNSSMQAMWSLVLWTRKRCTPIRSNSALRAAKTLLKLR